MILSQRFSKIDAIKFSFAKDIHHARNFAREAGAFSMCDQNFGLNVPGYLTPENQLRAVFREVILQNGIFLFNISGVNLNRARKGFPDYETAALNSQITEWELFVILTNKDYLKSCIFHNGKVQFKKTILWRSIML